MGRDYITLYHYTRTEYLEDILINRRLKVSEVGRSNDPFEMNPSFESGDRSTALMDSHLWNLEQCWKNFKDLDSTFYISLSCQMSSVLMWGHYANSHKGVCLVFKIPVNEEQDRFISRMQCSRLHLVPMLYRNERILVRDYVTEIRNDAIEYQLGDLKRHLISYKPKDWSYEREFRLVIPSAELKYEAGAIYTSILSENLVGVILGKDCPWSVECIQTLCSTADYGNRVAVYQSSLHAEENKVCVPINASISDMIDFEYDGYVNREKELSQTGERVILQVAAKHNWLKSLYNWDKTSRYFVE